MGEKQQRCSPNLHVCVYVRLCLFSCWSFSIHAFNPLSFTLSLSIDAQYITSSHDSYYSFFGFQVFVALFLSVSQSLVDWFDAGVFSKSFLAGCIFKGTLQCANITIGLVFCMCPWPGDCSGGVCKREARRRRRRRWRKKMFKFVFSSLSHSHSVILIALRLRTSPHWEVNDRTRQTKW